MKVSPGRRRPVFGVEISFFFISFSFILSEISFFYLETFYKSLKLRIYSKKAVKAC